MFLIDFKRKSDSVAVKASSNRTVCHSICDILGK